ncbi:SGNH/GDSL hydrolase family protein [Neobacillus niacini]|uniref:SGNH/GDSL hydrolase family protein n=1 Tax=Neobacillus niacini TaxID=86668 RepID=UPI000AFDD4F9|nr:SGNH/GDSL hydrolase family protein [Neobacillus niacini]MEC1525332.1 SGNH/GDSL hydrolase family protein [Neobacillus niacini]
MKQKKLKWISIIIGTLVVTGCLYLLLQDSTQTKVEYVKAVASVSQEQTKKTEDRTVQDDKPEEEEQTEQVEVTAKPIAENIKDKVREVLEVALDFLKKDQQIVAIGDSLTEGIGDETENGGYVGILNNTFEDNKLNITVQNFGKKGNRTDQLLKRLENEDIASAIKEADMVLITIGANDIMSVFKSNFMNVTMEPFQAERVKYMERLKAIFNKINELNPDTQIYLIGFYNPFERHFGEIKELGMIVENWNEAGKSVSEEYKNVRFIPTIDLFSNSTIDLLAEDEFHPNTSGYKLMAQRVLDYLKESNKETEMNSVEVSP